MPEVQQRRPTGKDVAEIAGAGKPIGEIVDELWGGFKASEGDKRAAIGEAKGEGLVTEGSRYNPVTNRVEDIASKTID